MKRTIRIAACLALLGTMAVSCQKEDFENALPATEESVSVYAVSYSIDGQEYFVTLVGDAAWADFLNRMLALSEEGHNVAFRLTTNSQITSAKEKLTFTTTDHDKAYEWVEQRALEGYTVYVDFDEESGIYTCIAIK